MGLGVVEMLEAGSRSMALRGQPIELIPLTPGKREHCYDPAR
jgi:hypothetical protein